MLTQFALDDQLETCSTLTCAGWSAIALRLKRRVTIAPKRWRRRWRALGAPSRRTSGPRSRPPTRGPLSDAAIGTLEAQNDIGRLRPCRIPPSDGEANPTQEPDPGVVCALDGSHHLPARSLVAPEHW